MRTIVVQHVHAQRFLSYLWFCGAQPFAKENPARLKIGSDCTNFGLQLTRDWNGRVKKQFKDGHMNCLMTDEGVVVTVPNTEDNGTSYLRVSFLPQAVSISYPRHDATSVLRTLTALLWLQDIGPLIIEGQQMNAIQAVAICSMSVARGIENGREGAPILFDMIQDGELNANPVN